MKWILCMILAGLAFNAKAEEPINWKKLFQAVAWKESRANPHAYNKSEQAIGIIQIRPICLEDMQRRYPYMRRYKHSDFCNEYLSYNAFILYGRMYGASTAEEFCRIWNGGPTGMRKRSTISYWTDIKKKYLD